MSSTNRGYDRHATDFYVTPPSCVREFLQAWKKDMPEYNFRRACYLDPCAGGDANHEMTYPQVLHEVLQAHEIATMDIREDSRANYNGHDYLTTTEGVTKCNDIIITNPPFYLAKEIIEKALNDVNEGGYVVMLLRLNFLGSKGRKTFFEQYPPERIYVHHKRMSFTDDGKTDSIEYMHAVWKKNYTPEATLLKII